MVYEPPVLLPFRSRERLLCDRSAECSARWCARLRVQIGACRRAPEQARTCRSTRGRISYRGSCAHHPRSRSADCRPRVSLPEPVAKGVQRLLRIARSFKGSIYGSRDGACVPQFLGAQDHQSDRKQQALPKEEHSRSSAIRAPSVGSPDVTLGYLNHSSARDVLHNWRKRGRVMRTRSTCGY